MYDVTMMTSVEIENFRGIRYGRVEDLPTLGVFVGSNGSGKSTVLEAAFIASFGDPARALGRVVYTRRSRTGARWLFHKGEPSPARITVAMSGQKRTLTLQQLTMERTSQQVRCEISNKNWRADIEFKEWNKYDIKYEALNAALPQLGQVRWIDPSASVQEQAGLEDLYSEAVKQGRRQTAKKLVKAVVPNLDDIEILTEFGDPVVHVVFENHSVPVGVTGDGVQSLIRLAFELASRPGGVALVEEPEAREHPAAIRQSAKAIIEAISRGIQVLVSTHSLEFIDALLAEASVEQTKAMAVYRFALDGGQLRSTRIAGEDVAISRGQIGDDLR